MIRRRTALGVLAFLAAGAVFGCLSPTIPLPPPALPSVEQGDEDGTLHLSSVRGAHPDAIIIIYNRNPDVPLNQRVSGSQADHEGSWDAKVYARGGDILDITQQIGNETSQTATLPVPTQVPTVARDAGLAGDATTGDSGGQNP